MDQEQNVLAITAYPHLIPLEISLAPRMPFQADEWFSGSVFTLFLYLDLNTAM